MVKAKKFVSLLLTGALALSMLAGCGNTQTETETSTPADTANTDADADADAGTNAGTDTASGEKVTVTILCAYASEDPHGQYVYQYADEFMKANPDITVEITAVSSNDIYTKLAAMATSPDDLPTLFFTSADQAPTLLDLGLMEDLNNYIDADTVSSFAEGVTEACTLNDIMAFYPIDVQPSAVIYRKDRFEEAGLQVPKTWDEFLECAKALTADTDGDGQTDQWGFSMVGANNSSGQSRFMSYLWSQGQNIVSYDDAGEEWKAEVEGEDFLKAFSFWTDLNNEYNVVPTGITEVDYATAANYFAMGYASMILSGSNALGVAYTNNPELKGKLGSFIIPGDHPGTMLNAEGYALCATADEAEKKAAAEFLKFFTNNDKDLMFWQSSGKIPATKEGQTAEYISGDDYAGFLGTVEAGCIPTVNFAGMSGLKGLLGDAYSSVFSGEKTNEQAVTELDKSLKTLLEDYN